MTGSTDEPPTLLDPEDQLKFTNDVPVPLVIDLTRGGGRSLQIRQVEQWLGLRDADGEPMETTVWGYGLPGQTATYPGPTILATEGQAIHINWQNKLPLTGHLLPVDTSIHLAEPIRKTLEDGFVPTVTHLHGGHSSAFDDGGPLAWFTQNNAERGPHWQDAITTYENDQGAATLWYHDHALGITRLNVYAGLAGFYLLRDENENGLIERGVLPGANYEFGLAIQDRSFTEDGQLYLPAYPGDPIPGTDETVPEFIDPETGEVIAPTILPEFFGDFMLVNGMIWPKMEVEATTYRFRLLNGSDSRFDVLQFGDEGVKVTLVGGDGGLLPQAITIQDGVGALEAWERLTLAPGERLDVVVDFSGAAGEQVTLLNFGPAFEPFKGYNLSDGSLAGGVESAQGTSVGEIMQFHVGAADPTLPKASVEGGTTLNPDYAPLALADAVNAASPRKLGLFEGEDSAGRVMPMLGVAEDTTDLDGNPVAFGALSFTDPITEVIRLGDTEVWEIHNLTEDAHPIHLHLVQFQVLGRYESIPVEAGDGDDMPGAVELGALLDVNPWQAGLQNLYAEDAGWQDTVWVGPGEALRIIADFDRPGEYVWHCHILSHEDNEMMRPFLVADIA